MSHYPPYTSKYNLIERKLFCHVTRAWSGVVFSDIYVVNDLVGKTSTSKGLKVFSVIKEKIYATARKVSDTFKENLPIIFDSRLGKWNYTAIPQV